MKAGTHATDVDGPAIRFAGRNANHSPLAESDRKEAPQRVMRLQSLLPWISPVICGGQVAEWRLCVWTCERGRRRASGPRQRPKMAQWQSSRREPRPCARTLTIDDDLAMGLGSSSRHGVRDCGQRSHPRGIAPVAKPAVGREPFRVRSDRPGLLPGVDPLKLNQLLDEMDVDAFVERPHGKGVDADPRR